MIQNNELRIGNILNYDTSEGEILPTLIDWQDLRWLTEDTKGFNLSHSPIPLTEEWLLRFGVEMWYEIGLKHYFIGDFSFVFQNGMIPKYKHIKYVHQLQNLYFALTGEELEFKNIT